ncbi:hypothetical protein [Actinospongicola halichondriae]|uniref:hypothetical protein n=1 Tax=Actinospongicola halichondriae TaxID=3236844 RepID=UPI003D5BCF12
MSSTDDGSEHGHQRNHSPQGAWPDWPTMTAKSNKDAENELFVAARSRGLSTVESAEIVGISDRTARRRLADPAMVERVREARAERLEALTDRMLELGCLAVSTLEDLLLEAQTPSVRLKAATTLLGELKSVRDHELVGRRLDELEAAREAETGDTFERWTDEA